MLVIEFFLTCFAVAQNGGKSNLLVAVPSLLPFTKYMGDTKNSAISLNVEEVKTAVS